MRKVNVLTVRRDALKEQVYFMLKAISLTEQQKGHEAAVREAFNFLCTVGDGTDHEKAIAEFVLNTEEKMRNITGKPQQTGREVGYVIEMRSFLQLLKIWLSEQEWERAIKEEMEKHNG